VRAIANLLRLAGLLVALVIAVGIALVVLDAKEDGTLVGSWLDVCRFLVEPFDRLIDLERGREELQIAINWGIAALVYLGVALLLGALLLRAAGRGFRRR
jgi:hypothetical protein